MTTSPPLPDGFTLAPDDRGGWLISRAGVYVGTVFPVSVPYPEGAWYARLPRKDARRCMNQAQAVEHITSHAPVIPTDSRRIS